MKESTRASSFNSPQLKQLRQLLVKHFSLEELRTLCFDLGLEFDEFGGEGKSAKVRELIRFAERHERLDNLIAEAATVRPALPWPTASAPDIPCPYLGLSAFAEEDADAFFGRETFTTQLLDAVRQQPFVAVLGASGSGKSSVVFAGLLPELRKEAGWLVVSMRPGANPIQSLAIALVEYLEPALRETDLLLERRKLTRALENEDLSLEVIVTRILQKAKNADKFLLIVDQFEELYTLVPDPTLRSRFLDGLLAFTKSDNSDQPLKIVLTMRADFLGQALFHRPFVDTLQDSSLMLGPMSADELQRAIVEPAHRVGVRFETGLVKRILDDVGTESGNLPLLEFALTEMWNWLTPERELTHVAYEQIERVEGALATYADEIFEGLSPEEQARAQRVFVQLVQPGLGTEDTRRLAVREEVGDANWSLAQQLANERLLITDRDSEDRETVEVLHEALIRNWGRLRGWMQVDGTFRLWQERLRAAMRQWATSQRDEGALLHGALLGEAEGWLEERAVDLSQDERQYIEVSIDWRQEEAAKREAQRQRELDQARKLAEVETERTVKAQELADEQRQRAEEQERTATRLRQRAILLVILALVAVMAAIAAGLLAVQSQNNLNLAETRGVDTENALATSDVNRDLAEAREVDAENALATSDMRGIELANIVGALETSEAFANEESARAVENANRAEREKRIADALALAAQSSEAFEHDFPTSLLRAVQAVMVTYEHGEPIEAEALGALYRSLVRGEYSIPLGHTDDVNSAAFSPDGTQIVTASFDGTARLWNNQGKLITTLEGHTGAVTSAVFSRDGTQIVTTSWDDTARLWDSQGNLVTTLEGHTSIVYSAAFSLDGTQIVTASFDGTARLWDNQGNLISTLEGHTNWVNLAAFSPDGTQIVTAGGDRDNTARLWDSQGNLITTLEGHTDDVNSAVFSLDGSQIVTASSDNTARLWDNQGNLISTLEGHTGAVNSATFSPDDTQIVTASSDNTARLWDGQGNPISILEGHTDDVNSAVFSLDGSQIVTASSDNTARLWDNQGNLTTTLEGHTDDVNSAVFSPDGTQIVTASSDGTARLRDSRGNLTTTLEGHTDDVNSAVFSPDGSQIVTASSDNTARLWDGLGNPISILEGHTGAINSATFSPDGTQIVSVSDDYTARVWDSQGNLISILEGHTNWVNSAVFSPDGTQIVTVSLEDIAQLWDSQGNLISTLEGHTSSIRSAAFSLDGSQIVTASSDNTARLWDSQGNLISILEGHTDDVDSAAFSLDGSQIVTASSDNTARLWDSQGNLISPLEGHTSRVNSAVFSPDGSQIVTASSDNTARLWDSQGNLITILEGHTDDVNSADFSRDGTQIVTASSDGTARLWDSQGNLTATLEINIGEVISAAFSPDGTQIITVSLEDIARLWVVDVDILLSEGKRRLFQMLTLEECKRYFPIACPPSAIKVPVP